MLGVGGRFENPRTDAILEIVRVPGDGAGVLELRRTLQSGTGKTITHVHRYYVERFVVEAGEALAKVEVQIGQRHVNPYTPAHRIWCSATPFSRLAISRSPMRRRWAT